MFVPHARVTLQADLPGGEISNCTFSIVPNGDLPGAGIINWLLDGFGNDGMDDLVADCVAFWGRVETHISARAVLKRVKVAPLDANGHYSGNVFERAVNQAGGQGGQFVMLPNQVARKITLETDADLGRVKGGFYLPGVCEVGWNQDTQLTDVATTEQVRDSVAQLIADVENMPGIDVTSPQVVVASQGRNNPNGTQRVAPGNFDVKRVNVGRRVDIQRRRANKVGEARLVDANV